MAVLFTIIAVFFIHIGLKVTLSNKPVILPAKYFFGIVMMAVIPQFLLPLRFFLHGGPGHSPMLILAPLIYVCILIFCWIQMKGYIVIGITDDSFRDALHFSLNINELTFDERLSAIKLTSLNTDLQIAVQSWVGVAQLKLKNNNNPEVLTKIVDGMKQFYNENDIAPNKMTSTFYIIIGILMMIFALFFAVVLPLKGHF
jgi:hypothetical protein